jgi:two-component sensor histidine kinase
MPVEHRRYIAEPDPSVVFESLAPRTVASHDGERTETRLREALAREEVLRRKNYELVRKLFAWRETAVDNLADLTPRQRQILELVLAGHPSKNIAADLGVSRRTVENHRASIMKKTGSRNFPALARLALAAGWNGADEPLVQDGSPVAAGRRMAGTCSTPSRPPATNCRGTIAHLQYGASSSANAMSEGRQHRTPARHQGELVKHRLTELRLLKAVAREEALLRQKDDVIEQQETLRRESDHRLLNGLQMIASLLSLQCRAAANAEAAGQLAVAAHRVATIERVHRRLHQLDGVQTVNFKHYLEDLCGDLSTMLSSGERPDRVIFVEGIDIELATVTAVPLAFIANELITNAIKYGKGRITVGLERGPGNGYALSVSDDGGALPKDFDPAACKGLGMKIVRSLVGQIGGELRIGRGDKSKGTRFSVLFW